MNYEVTLCSSAYFTYVVTCLFYKLVLFELNLIL